MNRYARDPNCIKAEYQGDTVYFILTSQHAVYAPPPHPSPTPWPRPRAWPRLPPSTRRIIHEAKRHGARITTTGYT